ncbi:MAG: Gfo/Idh/MocA family protein [Kiritimatiellia bacterium]
MSKEKLSRRSFLAHAGGAVALPWLVPASALGRDGAVAPSNRIVMGAIGLGNRGTSDLCSWVLPEKDVQFVAICDVRKDRRDAIKALTDQHYGNTDCAQYIDMKELLARPDIDAILTATSDRWHAGVSIMAMRAGKDVYTEKPASMTVREGQAVVATAKKCNRVYQAGMQRLSEPNFVVCNELLRLGRLGEVKLVYAHLAPWGNVNLERRWLPAQKQPPREIVDWDAWLGPCAWRPYNEHYLHGGWHRDHDLYTGVIGEWGSHTFAQCHDAIGAENTSPVFYPCMHKSLPDGLRMRFANGVEMITCQRGWRGTCGVRYVGSEGWVSCADGYSRPEVSRPSLLADYEKILADYFVRTGYTGQNHLRQFLNSVRTRTKTIANPVMMHRSMTTVHCANIAQWLGRDMHWDPVKEEFINDPEANRMLSRAQREGWEII